MTNNPTVADKAGNEVKMYRKQQSSLFKFDIEQDAYVHVYQCPFANGLSDMITRYEIAGMYI